MVRLFRRGSVPRIWTYLPSPSSRSRVTLGRRFYRADKARSRELGGAGIGLAIAEWIVQQHRGSIAVQSSMGNGSTFLIEFPLQPVSAVSDLSQALAFTDYAKKQAST
ncbi:MAG: ATP-binding protein [Candidatus Sulfotelmatobacter sp.]